MIRKSMFNKHINAGNERRGVAPIIATLLTVAIAVVGGILMFVFAQGFFNRTSDLEVGGNEALVLTGYDARDSTTLKAHNGLATTIINPTANGMLDGTKDAIAIYVRNSGTNTVTISTVECNDIQHNTFDDSAGYGTTIPTAGAFAVDTNAISGDMLGSATAEIAGGQQGTIYVRYNGDDLPNGRNMSCKVFTQGGNVFTIPVSIGKRET